MKELLQLFLAFCKIGAFMFGGGYSMLPLLSREIVDRHGWASEQELLDYFAIAQCTPGIIAINTATFIGHKRKGILGAAFATVGVVFVPMILIIVIALVLQPLWNQPFMIHAFKGIRIAVTALIVSAIIRLARSSIHNWVGIVLSAAAFILIAFLGQSPVFVIICAGMIGIVYGRIRA